MNRVALHVVNVLRSRSVAVAQGAAAVLQKRVPCQGYAKLKGTLHLAAGATPAAGFPRIVEYQDQTTATGPSRITVLAQDASQPDVSFPIDYDLSCPYVGIEYTDNTGGGTTIKEAQAELRSM